VHFNRLRLSGFKSFVDAVELIIEPGLTGIVGPNGCGKSNLIEALRWVMGETSAKKMRGSGMDDVIFSGTAARPARNIAEVVLQLDNADRSAPAQFNGNDEIEILRRIERDLGSDYRINGADVRARDVQRLFADLATGAHTKALVSQGEIGGVINAKPVQRRLLLEEAAGITGLHSRRHEAELRLRAAETNLERLDDVMQNMDVQLRGLKRQARQATRYKNLSGHIRKAQALLLYLRWTAAEDSWQEARRQLTEADSQVTGLTRDAARKAAAEAEKAETLPPLRQDEAVAAVRIHRLTLTQDSLDDEERQALTLAKQLEMRLQQIHDDAVREGEHAQDSTDRLGSLALEREEIHALQATQHEAVAQVEERATMARQILDKRERELELETDRIARESAHRERLNAEAADLGRRFEHSVGRLENLGAERKSLMITSGEEDPNDDSIAELAQLRRAVAAARTATDAAESLRSETHTAEISAREVLQKAEGELARSRAEADALRDLLSVNEDDLWPPLIDSISVDAGFEAALGAALGDDLVVSSDDGAPAHWRGLPPFQSPPSLPTDAVPLSQHVKSPGALNRRMTQIGIVNDQAMGDRLRNQLQPGQRLVTLDGALWRWDGYTVRSGAATTATTRLNQRNRLKILHDEISHHTKTVDKAQKSFAVAHAAESQAVVADNEARTRLSDSLEELHNCEERRSALSEERARRESRLAAIDESIIALEADGEAMRQRQGAIAQDLSKHRDPEADRNALAALRTDVAGLRQEEADAASERRRIEGEAAARVKRQTAIAEEDVYWQQRLGSASSQLEQLAKRETEANSELELAKARPQALSEQRSALLEKMANAETERNAAADVLARAELELANLVQISKDAQATLAEAREKRVRIEGRVSQSDQLKSDVSRTMREALECTPAEISSVAEITEDKNLPDVEAVEARHERLKRERENMGPVNLRADAEAEELSDQLELMQSEREDLEAAIARLRQGISNLNREGRERVLSAFKAVDGHFGELFKRLFGGGEARLSMVDSDDPLEAGLEILASPPGKRLQVMSLLSGGEQALTAIALLFAVFLTNPAPVCVLDEVDAPLDDANVERFLDLVGEIARDTATRFLIITHNPLSMSHMDRLFGVTMAERGVSQLVSVDLAQAEDLRATA
jgi:chromosome segregation protein